MSVWGKLEKQIQIERAALNRAIETHRPLLDKVGREDPTPIELSALAALLHSFYTGIENLCKRITVELGDSMPQGAMWHVRLKDFLAIVTMDAHGSSLHADIEKASAKELGKFAEAVEI